MEGRILQFYPKSYLKNLFHYMRSHGFVKTMHKTLLYGNSIIYVYVPYDRLCHLSARRYLSQIDQNWLKYVLALRLLLILIYCYPTSFGLHGLTINTGLPHTVSKFVWIIKINKISPWICTDLNVNHSPPSHKKWKFK